jgi:hypothetical protein
MAVIPSKSEERAIERELAQLRGMSNVTFLEDIPTVTRQTMGKIHRYVEPSDESWPPKKGRK